MFTGLIREKGEFLRATGRPAGVQLHMRAPGMAAESDVGDSVACDGICLTIERLSGDSFEAHAGAETMRRTTLHSWRPGRAVNLEPALLPSDRLGGHFVQGHVDCVGVCTGRKQTGETVFYSFSMPSEQMAYVAEKGSIAVDGISLTVTAVDGNRFTIAIIPHTMDSTTLPDVKAGRQVNIELDILAKYVRKMLAGSDTLARPASNGITEQLLREQGFIN